jgi:hypothetical protein
MEAQPDLTWRKVPADICIAMQERVNVELAREHIPTIEYDVFSWRMARVMQYKTCEQRCLKYAVKLDLTHAANKKCDTTGN